MIDFRHTEYFCSEFIYLLIKLHRRVKEQRGRMALVRHVGASARSLVADGARQAVAALCVPGGGLGFRAATTLDILVVDDSEVIAAW